MISPCLVVYLNDVTNTICTSKLVLWNHHTKNCSRHTLLMSIPWSALRMHTSTIYCYYHYTVFLEDVSWVANYVIPWYLKYIATIMSPLTSTIHIICSFEFLTVTATLWHVPTHWSYCIGSIEKRVQVMNYKVCAVSVACIYSIILFQIIWT